MFYLTFDHNDFDRYYDNNISAVTNVILILDKLSDDATSIPDLNRLINPPERIEINKVFEIYPIIERLVNWGYIKKEKNKRKYDTGFYFCVLTDSGKECLRLIPLYLARTITEYQGHYDRLIRHSIVH